MYHSEPESSVRSIIVTKIDIEHDQNDVLKIKAFARRNNWQFHLTSAKNCVNVDEAFEKLIKETLKKKYMINNGEEEDFNDQSEENEQDLE